MELRKRPHEQDESRPSKTVRHELQKLPDGASDIEDFCYEAEHSQELVDSYSSLAHFAIHNKMKLSNKELKIGDDMARATEDILGTLEECRRQTARLEKYLNQMVQSLTDLMNTKILQLMVEEIPDHDLDDFGRYLYELVESQGFADVEHRHATRKPPSRSFEYIENAYTFMDLLRRLWHQEGTPACLHAFQIMNLLRVNLFAYEVANKEYELSYSALQNATTDLWWTGVDALWQKRLLADSSYLNVAMAVRLWQNRYHDPPECVHDPFPRSGEPGFDGMWAVELSSDPGTREHCFRRRNLFNFGHCQKAAWSGIRYGVMTTIGRLVSADIAEMIFESTLEAEGIPNDPEVWEQYGKDPDEKQPKLEYDCRHGHV